MPTSVRFDLFGEVRPLAKALESAPYIPSRPLGGWLATYGKIGANGGVVPTTDREGHIFEAASTLGRIDFSDYLAKGKWNDTHSKVYVGLPTSLEFHDEHTDLAKAHKKVGFWTEGHLFDRADPRSWTLFGDYEPTSQDLARSDYFWGLATMLKGMPRPLGFSAHGKMLLSPCGKRIIWARVEENAVCEIPQNPDASAMPLRLAAAGVALDVRPGMVGASPCDACRCPPGARCKTVAARKGEIATSYPQIEDLEELPQPEDERSALDLLTDLLVQKHGVSRRTAERWTRQWAATQGRGTATAQETA